VSIRLDEAERIAAGQVEDLIAQLDPLLQDP